MSGDSFELTRFVALEQLEQCIKRRSVMARYHVNPETGNPNICRAKVESSCLYRDEPHYDSKEEARAGYEAKASKLLGGSLQGSKKTSDSKVLKIQLKENGYLTKEFENMVEINGVGCPKCGEGITGRQASEMLWAEYVSCKKCDTGFDLAEAKVQVKKGSPSYKFLRKEEVLKATWYHATSKENWIEEGYQEIEDFFDNGDSKGEGDFEVHVGTEAAAYDRALSEYAGHDSRAEPFYLYEVRLDPSSSIANDIADDENSEVLEGSSDDVVRYVNRYEDMASISLAVKSSKIQILGKRLVQPGEAHRRLSPYNVDAFDD